MPELELRHLRAVRAIAEEGSLTKAASRLGLTQPALSAQLRTVERIVGGRLFERTPSGSVPTDLGRQVVRTARLVLDELTELVSSARKSDRSGPLIVGGVPLLYFAQFIGQLRAECADVRSEIVPSSSELLDLLIAGQVHLAIFERFEGMETRELRGIEVRTLVTEPQMVAVSDHDPLAAQDEIELGQLASRDWVTPPAEQIGIRVQIFRACAEAGFTPRLTHHTADAGTARGLVAAGAVSFADAPSRSGDGIVIRPLSGTPITSEVVVATRREGPVAGRAHEVFACAARAYRTILDRNPAYRRWWEEHPEAHADLDAIS